MLVETNKKGDVITLKLTTSEELIGSYENDDDASYTIGRPFMIVLTSKGIALAPWLNAVDMKSGKPVKISKKHIVAVAEPQEYIAKEYNSQMSGIKLV
tara:strand:- start:249 stop:542 length:294 start_codon:yes stop_codon:yes gene_type:complete